MGVKGDPESMAEASLFTEGVNKGVGGASERGLVVVSWGGGVREGESMEGRLEGAADGWADEVKEKESSPSVESLLVVCEAWVLPRC
mmetsp:Transcript_10716/g.23713  ORF Transcript_10716/g.23713 Transcript_10716/m.23713 type:complete len:87 (-) Transcript_10716:41-301(-)